MTWAHYVAQGKGLLDHLNIKRAHLMGACMGCCPVVAFGVAYPEATLSMVLIGCVRMRNQDVVELFELVPAGTQVRIAA